MIKSQEMNGYGALAFGTMPAFIVDLVGFFQYNFHRKKKTTLPKSSISKIKRLLLLFFTITSLYFRFRIFEKFTPIHNFRIEVPIA